MGYSLSDEEKVLTRAREAGATNMALTTNDLNNDTIATGIFENDDGTFTALAFSASKDFKTYAGAARWLARRGL